MRSCDTKLCRLYNKLSSTVHHNSSPHIFGSIHISLSGGRLTRVERLGGPTGMCGPGTTLGPQFSVGVGLAFCSLDGATSGSIVQ